ncbi:MAG: glycosyltransferase family 2 protein [Sporichthyaceae bacterium]
MPGPKLSLIVPMYGVEAYLPQFLASLDAQSEDLVDVELVFVDDGSPDRSAQIAADWMAAHRAVPTHLISQCNGGLAAARNAGLAASSGEWVSFPDPDDVLTPAYLAAVRRFLEAGRAAKVMLAATNLVYLDEESGARRDAHPLRFKFAGGHHRIVDLARRPDHIHLSAASAWYRGEVLRSGDLRFDSRITPTFEDAHLTARYLRDDPRIALLEDAVYLYRRRSDVSSAVQSGWFQESKYRAVPRHGWLDLVRSFTDAGQELPRWVANMVLYDLIGFFRADLRPDSPTHDIPVPWREAFLEATAEVLSHLGPAAIADYSLGWCPSDVRRALLYGFGAGPVLSDVHCDRIDLDQDLVRVSHYRYSAAEPSLTYSVRGVRTEPVHSKVRKVEFYGRTLARQHTAWLPLGGVRVWADGAPLPVHVGPHRLPRYVAGPGVLQAQLSPAGATMDGGGEPAESRAPCGRGGGRGTWLLMGTRESPGVYVEALYEVLHGAEPSTPVWVMLEESSPDRPRLAGAGVPLATFGSAQALAALADCRHLVTSELDERFWAMVALASGPHGPPRVIYLPPVPVREVDHRTLNRHPLDLVVVADQAQYQLIVTDGSPFAHSAKEVAVTGLPGQDSDGGAAHRIYQAIRSLDLPHDARPSAPTRSL